MSDPNEMGRALIAAAAEAGIRITLIDCLLPARPDRGCTGGSAAAFLGRQRGGVGGARE